MFGLGVDPGASACGYGCISTDRAAGEHTSVVAMGVITTPPADELPVRLGALNAELHPLLVELRPAVVAVERLFFQANARSAMSVGQASGLVLAAASAA